MADGRLLVENRVESKPFQVLSTSLVKPAVETPSEKRWQAFSNLDIIWMPFYTQAMSVYKATEAGRDVGKRLRESLQSVLMLFYPLAGRVVTESNEHGAAGILCNDAGAVFVEASIDADLEEFQYENFQPSFRLTGMAEAGLGDYPRLPDDPAGRPALIVQMTHFRCGGITLAFNWAHPVADGFSGFHFLKSWAELARGEEVSLLPVHDRALVKPRKRLILSNPFTGGHPELQTSDGEQTFHDLVHRVTGGRNYLVSQLKKLNLHSESILHLDISSVVNPETFNVLLFELLVLGCLKSDIAGVFHLNTSNIHIEIGNTLGNELARSLPVCDWFQKEHLSWNLESLEVDNNPSCDMQVVCIYLHAMELR